MSAPKGRATTPEMKRAVVELLLESWLRAPEQRLGQLLVNAIETPPTLFFVEDSDLAARVVDFVTQSRARRAKP